MGSVLRQRLADARGLFPPLAAVLAAISVIALTASTPWAGARSKPVVPALGSYRASGRTDPANYTVRAQVKRKGGRKVVSSQVADTCGGFATFAPTAIARADNGAPAFSAQVGAAAISGRWTSSTRIEGKVDTPCARPQDYVMHLTG